MTLLVAIVGALIVAVVVALAIPSLSGLAGVAEATPLLQPISSDPYTNPSSHHKTQVEPHVLAEGSTILAAFQVGRFYEAGASNIGWSRSIDDGVTWMPGYLPGLTVFEGGGTYASASDPTVAYDRMHDVWLITTLGIYPGPSPGTFAPEGDVVTSRSLDGGTTWENPVMIAGNGAQALDKPWAVCDNTPASPYYGNCYATYDDYGNGGRVFMSTSSDGGLTWSTPSETGGLQGGLGGVPVVQPDGTVVVPLLGNGGYIDAFFSTNGGNTWSTTTHISRIRFFSGTHSQQSSIRGPPLPASAIDSAGRVFVVWSDCRFARDCRRNDLVMSVSSDGVQWSKVKRLPLDVPSSRADHVGPSIGIDPDSGGPSAAIGLTSYTIPNPSHRACKPAKCRVFIDYASSTDGGKHWTRGQQIAGPMTLKWAPSTSGGYMFGDYFATTVSSDDMAVPVLSVAEEPAGAELDQAINSGRFAIVPGSFKASAR